MSIDDRDWYREGRRREACSDDYYYDPKQFRRPANEWAPVSPPTSGPPMDINLGHLLFWMLVLVCITLLVLGFEARKSPSHHQDGKFSIAATGSGHYFLPGRIAKQPLKFLLDTGATVTAISRNDALLLALHECTPVLSNTANGVAKGCATKIDLLEVGPYRIANVDILILPELGSPLLGMNVLRHFSVQHQFGKLSMAPLPGSSVLVVSDNHSPKWPWQWSTSAALMIICIGIAVGGRWRAVRAIKLPIVDLPKRRRPGPAGSASPYEKLVWACDGDLRRVDELLAKFPLVDQQRAAELALQTIWK